jgi:hypothetical protein
MEDMRQISWRSGPSMPPERQYDIWEETAIDEHENRLACDCKPQRNLQFLDRVIREMKVNHGSISIESDNADVLGSELARRRVSRVAGCRRFGRDRRGVYPIDAGLASKLRG